MQKIFWALGKLVDYKISLKELYFSLSSWLVLLILFLGQITKFQHTLMIINLVIAFIVFLVIILFTNRILLSSFITLLLAVSFDYIKQIKWQFLLQDLSAADFFMLKLLINHGLLRLIYEYATKEIYVIIILLLLNFVLLWNKSDTLLDKTKLGSKNFYALRLISIGLAFLIVTKLFDSAIDRNSSLNYFTNSIRLQVAHSPKKIYGPFADVLFSLKDIFIAPTHIESDETSVLEQIRNIGVKPGFIASNNMPDIVVILNESTINPYNLDYDFVQNFDFKFFKDGKYTKYSGMLDVNTFGGSSWISEYEINTGIPHKLFQGPSYMPFISLVPHTKNSLFSYLKSIGYETSVVYPIDKNFSTALDAYTKLGADNVYDIFDFGFKPDSWAQVPDSVIGDIIVKILDKPSSKPRYIFAATMLNHGPHSKFKIDKLGCSDFMHDALCSKLNDYLTRLSKTNNDQLELIDKLMSREKKTILVNFGDHMPSFEGYSTQLRFAREIRDFYKTFYNINTNFANTLIHDKYPLLDITFIPGLILDIAGLNSNNFYKANSYMRKNCMGNYKNCKNFSKSKLFDSYKSYAIKQLEF